MAERRMFAKTIIDSDFFLDMPLSTQSLYFHLSMRADDDGFVNNPKKIMRMIGASSNEFDILVSKRFLILFESGVVVIKHWKIHNYIQKDRYKETVYREEKEMLLTKENKTYTLKKDDVYSLDTEGVQDGYAGKVREELGELSIGYKEKNTKKENPQPPTNWDDDEPAIQSMPPQPDIPPSQDPIQESASELIGNIINHWNGKSNLPNCRYQSFSIPGISDFTAKLSVFSLSEIIKAIDNLSDLWEKIEPKYRHRTLSKFIVKIDDWTDEAEPWERYKSGNASTVSPEEAERLAAEAFPSRGGK